MSFIPSRFRNTGRVLATGLLVAVLAGKPAVAGETTDKLLGGTLFTTGILAGLVHGPHQQARMDEIIPRGSWILDCLAGLASENRLPLLRGQPYDPEYFYSHIFTRGEIAALVSEASRSETVVNQASTLASPAPVGPSGPVSAGAAPDSAPGGGASSPSAARNSTPGSSSSSGATTSTAAATRPLPEMVLLLHEFRHELQESGVAASAFPQDLRYFYHSNVRAQLGVSSRGAHIRPMGRGDVEGVLAGAQYSLAVGNINPGGFERPFHLSPLNDPVLGVRPVLTYDPDSLYLKGIERLSIWREFAGWTVELGRNWLDWGQAYSGGLLLSDNTGPLDMLRVERNFNLGLLGTWRFQQFAAYDQEPVGGTRYLLGRRFEKALSNEWHGSISEALVSQGRPPWHAYFLPFYWSQYIAFGHGHEQSANESLNYLIDFQLGYRNARGNRYYGDILIDDIVFPVGRQQYAPPRKAGFLLGTTLPQPMPCIDKLTAEAVYTDATSTSTSTYLHVNPGVAYFRYGNVIGNPIGPGSSGVVLRADLWPRYGWLPFVQGTVEQHNRLAASPDVEIAALVGGTHQLYKGRALSAAIRPHWDHNWSNIPGKNRFRVDAQIFISGQY